MIIKEAFKPPFLLEFNLIYRFPNTPVKYYVILYFVILVHGYIKFFCPLFVRYGYKKLEKNSKNGFL